MPEFRILRPLPDRKYPLRHALPYMVETDPGVHAIVYRLTQEPLLSRPPRDTNKAILYVSHESADDELRDEPLVRDLIKAEPEAAFYACDVRGVGDSEPQTTSLNRPRRIQHATISIRPTRSCWTIRTSASGPLTSSGCSTG